MKEQKNICLKVDGVEPVYKAGFGICSRGTQLDGIKVWIGGDGHFFECDKFSVYDPDVVREAGRRQVVELVKELAGMKFTDKNELFDYCSAYDIISHFSYDEIVEKLDAWKKEKEAIHVKDEVQHKEFGGAAVVIGIQRDEYGHDRIFAITKKKEFIADAPASDYTKTGVHVDDLDAYLGV